MTWRMSLTRRLLRGVRRVDIFRRLMAAFLLVILLPTAVIGVFTLRNTLVSSRKSLADSIAKSLRSLEASINGQLSKYDDLTYHLSMNQELRKLLRYCSTLSGYPVLNATQRDEYIRYRARIGEMLDLAAAQYPGVLNIQIVTDDDEFLRGHAGDAAQDSFYLRNPDAFRVDQGYLRAVAAAGQPVWANTSSEISVFRWEGNPRTFLGNYITHLRSIEERGSLGVIVLNISLSVFSEIENPMNLDVEQSYALLLGEGAVVTYIGVSRSMHFLKMDEEVISALSQPGLSLQVRQIGAQDYLVSSIRDATTGWTLNGIVNKKEADSATRSMVFALISIVLSSLFLSMATSYVVAKSIANPLNELRQAMDSVDGERLDVSYLDDSPDVVGLLGGRFNRMVVRIRGLIDQVYRVELEKKEETLRRIDAELHALQMQINPHFLYNTLDIIRWQLMAEQGGESRASDMILRFSELMALSTDKQPGLVPLSEEIRHVQAYLRVVAFDQTYPIRLALDVPERMAQVRLPKLSLQPIVENAVLHGFRDGVEGAVIRIGARVEGEDALISIGNNGKPIQPLLAEDINQSLSKKQEAGQVGLRNVHERLVLSFGSAYGLTIDAVSEQGTVVLLRLPAGDGQPHEDGGEPDAAGVDRGRQAHD